MSEHGGQVEDAGVSGFGEQVAVDVEGHLGAGVAEHVAEAFDIDALADGEAGEGVPDVVDADGWEACLLGDAVPAAFEVAWVDGFAAVGGEDEVVFFPGFAALEGLGFEGGLDLALLFDDLDGVWWEGDEAS